MTFASREDLVAFLNRHRLVADKSLGQHFLADPTVVSAMVRALGPVEGVLEVGPGPGILSGPLTEAIPRVRLIEIDPRMKKPLWESAPTAEVTFADALQTELGPLLDALPSPRALVSNMPYYITAPLLDRFAGQRSRVERMVLMMQREVGDRIAARAGKGERGSLSVYLQRLFTVERLFDVAADAFYPPPKVKSTVLLFTPRDTPDDPEFSKLLKLGFSQPRKTLANNLATGLKREREAVVSTLAASGIEAQKRPHELTEEAWLDLYAQLGSD